MRLLLVCILFCQYFSIAKADQFSINTIPPELLRDANMIIRQADVAFTITGSDEAIYSVKVAYTILNENAKDYASRYIYYDQYRRVSAFSGAVYDAQGKLIRKLRKSDIQDQSAVSGFSLYEDSRVRFADLSTSRYPYTVAFEYEVRYKYLYSIPSFVVMPNQNIAVEKATYSLTYPPDLVPRYKVMNISNEPTKSSGSGVETLTWRFENMDAFKWESFGSSPYEQTPYIMLAPTKFKYDGYAGEMDTWERYGNWISLLGQGRSELNEATKLKVHELVNGKNTIEEKARVLYEYMQNKTRYVSIQLGIGGLQPFEASVVDQTGYGDCKALSNYMVALLEEVGIKGYYALINAGRGAAPVQTDLPSHQFNHAIVAVPNGLDTLWLECTSQTNPFGYLGTFTSDRYALLISDQGSKLVKTPTYDEYQNLQTRKADVFVSKNGEAQVSISTTYTGLQYENDGLYAVLNQKDALEKWLNRNINIPSFDLEEFAVDHTKDQIPSAKIDVKLNIAKLGTVSGRRLFLLPNLMNRNSFVPEINQNRQSDIIINMGWTDFDTIRYHLPEQVSPEFIPEPILISSVFGDYEASFVVKEGMLVYYRKVQLKKGRYSPDNYEALREFYANIRKADNMRMVFLSET